MKQSQKTAWIIIASLIVGAGIIFWSYQSTKLPEPGISGGGTLVAEAETYDFGEVSMAKGLVEYQFILNNSSSAPVKIGQTETSCMCTTAYLRVGENGKEVGPFEMPGHGPSRAANLTVNPGEKLIVRTVFDPAAHGPAGVGAVERAVIMDVGGQEPLVLSFTALVTP